jgi:predicted O-methyltransferase YrrM
MHSGTRYSIHSPFLYAFIGEVIRGDRKLEGFKRIEKIRKEYTVSGEVILKTDYGEGSEGDDKKIYPVTLRHIARTSLSSPRLARRLYRLVNYMEPMRILEIGTSVGLTTSYMAMANPHASVITIEGCPELSRLANENFRRLGLANIELLEGRFEDQLDIALEKLVETDLLFVDGNHRKEAVLNYFERCIPYINNETVMVFDDIHASDGMEQAWEKIRMHPAVTVSMDLFFTGWIFFRRESSREHFNLRYI